LKYRVEVNPVRGFRDILGKEAQLLLELQKLFTKLAESYGYEPVIPPTVERFELFALKSGEEIRRSMYVFKDKAGREVALRPEATASIARIYLRLLRAKPKPIKLYYTVNCFRYEEPQRARYREFWQAGVEYLGEPSVSAEFDTIRLLIKFYEKINMTKHIRLKLGTTKLYRIIFNKYGIGENEQDHILHLMDKKMYSEAIDYITGLGKGELAELLEKIWTNPNDISMAAKILGESQPETLQALEELQTLIGLLRDYSRDVEVKVDLSFARGLAYYTGIIYEVETNLIPVSIAGGGRYDNLIEVYGGEKVPGTGFAIGLDRTLQALLEAHLEEQLLSAKSPKRVAILVLEEKVMPYAARVQDLLAERYRTSLVKVSKLHKILPKLPEQGYTLAVIVGPNEAEEGKVTVRDLAKRRQSTRSLEELSKKPLEELV
jgi:histidyl-tRNA synthetase